MHDTCTTGEAVAGGDTNIADLVVLSYEGLLRGDDDESAKLLSACAEWGFFYLDLGPGGQEILETVDQLFSVAKEYFARPLEEKLRDSHDDEGILKICGQLPYDLMIPTRDERIKLPQGIQKEWPTIARFMADCRGVCTRMLNSLSNSMGLEGDRRLEQNHRDDSPSTTAAVLQCYPVQNLPPNTSQGHFTHTDAGTISMLFTSEWGLQVHSPRTEQWAYVAPRRGCAIVNVGDSLRFLADFKLRSSLHRVVPDPERWLINPRYSVLFFLRASNDAVFTDSEGVNWSGSEWLNKKFGNYRNSHRQQQESAMSTGKKGYLGLWKDTRMPTSSM
ncbi:2OG-Fe(II) oxygenase family oxidoreductase [Colletotrichum sp. SAR11_239]|nr:2OG-Fe(II) oxygenase family oxidoreductase [Colletotrichum sp. SAR11_239]